MNVEIWADTACPFCYMNHGRFAAALAAFEHRDEVTVTLRSYELEPDAPRERTDDNADRLAAKYGWTREAAAAKLDQLALMAKADGLDFRYDIQRLGSSFDGHRLVHLAAEHDLGDRMLERIMYAFWTEGALVADHDTLARLAAEVGVPEGEVRATLASDRFADAVRSDEAAARERGFGGVPTILVDGRHELYGSQSTEQLEAFLHQGWAARDEALT
jgi:predicted DsbA family dithiol-disulfide isomerase